MATANDVANYLVSLRNDDEKSGKYFSLSNLKLQKLLYFCQGGHFQLYKQPKQPLIVDKNFEAWPYGPVIPEIYSRFSKYGQNDVSIDEAKDYNLTLEEAHTIKQIWELLKYRDPFELVEETHVPNSPWHNVYHKNLKQINNEDIFHYFASGETNSAQTNI